MNAPIVYALTGTTPITVTVNPALVPFYVGIKITTGTPVVEYDVGGSWKRAPMVMRNPKHYALTTPTDSIRITPTVNGSASVLQVGA